MSERYLALDVGAESGRALVGNFDGDRLTIEEVRRFANRPVRLPTALHWDALALLAELRAGIAAAQQSGAVRSLAIDTWGVDFGLLDERGALLGNPVHYRDARTDGLVEAALGVVPREEIFDQTGIQFLPINSLYQLLAMARADDPSLRAASTLLMMPDLFNYWLTGEKVAEYTIATTSQCFNTRTGTWAEDLLERLGIPREIFLEVRMPGTTVGPLRDELGALEQVRVVLAGSHDTASAVAGTPLRDSQSAYISSGTWSLAGVETPEPVIDERTLAWNFTNEGGVAGSIRLLRNVMGLWLVQGLRRGLQRDGSTAHDYDTLTQAAAASPPFQSVIDPDAPAFLRADDMPGAFRTFCIETHQRPPETAGAFVRAALEGLALRYRWVVERLEAITGCPIGTVHVVGGGTRNRLLCQMTADATARPVMAGPVEATAIGNLVVQLMAAARISSLSDGRSLVARSFPVEQYMPSPDDRWNEAYRRFLSIDSHSKGQ